MALTDGNFAARLKDRAGARARTCGSVARASLYLDDVGNDGNYHGHSDGGSDGSDDDGKTNDDDAVRIPM
eukprot:8286928-Pyramimonas_sp.AAC.1